MYPCHVQNISYSFPRMYPTHFRNISYSSPECIHSSPECILRIYRMYPLIYRMDPTRFLHNVAILITVLDSKIREQFLLFFSKKKIGIFPSKMDGKMNFSDYKVIAKIHLPSKRFPSRVIGRTRMETRISATAKFAMKMLVIVLS